MTEQNKLDTIHIAVHKNSKEDFDLHNKIIEMLQEKSYSVAEVRGLFADILKTIECNLALGAFRGKV